MEITSREYKRVHVMRVAGRVDAKTAPQFEEALHLQISSGTMHIVVEMDGTEFLSSAGVRALINAQKALKSKGGRVIIAQPSQRIREVIQISGMEALFPIYDDTVAAVGSV